MGRQAFITRLALVSAAVLSLVVLKVFNLLVNFRQEQMCSPYITEFISWVGVFETKGYIK